MKRLGVVLAVALALLLCGWWWSRGGADARADPGAVAEARQPAPTPESVAFEVAPADARAALPREEPKGVPEAPVAASPARTDQERTLSGTIVVLDERDLEHASESGSFVFVLGRGNHGSHHKVEVDAGRWTTTIPEEVWPELMGLAEITLGNRHAIDDGSTRWSPRDPSVLSLRVRWPLESRLFVRDAATGAELDDVRLVAVNEWPLADLAHPGDAAAGATACGRSPVVVPAALLTGSGRRVLFARAAGHAWGHVEIDADRGGDRVVALEPGGDLDVQIVGVVEDPNLVLRIFRGEDYRPLVEMRLLERRKLLQIDGLVPGACRIVAQIGEYWSDHPLELGSTEVVVEADRRTSAVLVLEALVKSPRVPFAGTLVIPPEWALEDFALDFELQETALGVGDGTFRIQRSEMERSGDIGTYRWKARDVQVGHYEAEIAALAFSVVLDVRVPGLEDARIEVPPPAAVTVRCVDDSSGAELEGAGVDWHFKPPEGGNGFLFKNAAWDAAARCFTFRAPVGTVLIGANCRDYGRTSKEFAIAPGDNAIVMRLSRLCSLRAILRDGDAQVPIGGGLEIALIAAEGQQEYESRSWGDGAVIMHRVQPGLYTLKVPPIPGFEPVPDATVRLETGRVIEHVVQLVRTH